MKANADYFIFVNRKKVKVIDPPIGSVWRSTTMKVLVVDVLRTNVDVRVLDLESGNLYQEWSSSFCNDLYTRIR